MMLGRLLTLRDAPDFNRAFLTSAAGRITSLDHNRAPLPTPSWSIAHGELRLSRPIAFSIANSTMSAFYSSIHVGDRSLVFKPVWTVVDARRKRSFGLSTKGTEKTALVGFLQRTDALYVARAIEQFRLKNNRWPYSHAIGEKDTLVQLEPPKVNLRTLAALELRVWNSISCLSAECQSAYLDLCLCSEVKRGPKLEFVGKYVELEPDAESFCAMAEFAWDINADSAQDFM